MTREEAIADIRDNIKPVVGGKSLDMAIKSLEAWEKVRKDLRKFIDANSNSGDMYLDGRADGGWHALATIKRCLAEVENESENENIRRNESVC